MKWTKEGLDFWKKKGGGGRSVFLNVLISVGSVSQTGYGFEDLVNSINSQKYKIKKLFITDTTYLYRHCVPEFAVYQDQKLQTPWQQSNKGALSKLEVDTEVKSWANEIKSELFYQWYKQILQDYTYDKSYRELTNENASIAALKGNCSFEQCRNFILEEGAHLCAVLKNAVIAYPMAFCSSIRFLIEKYKLNITHLTYKLSSFSRKRNSISDIKIGDVDLEKKVLPFLLNTLNANFFIIDKSGKYIYKNNKLAQVVGDSQANEIDPRAWLSSQNVMKQKKQIVVEEKGPKGKYYLSVKAPLNINDEIHGIMGLSIDITDKKKIQELEYELKVEQQLHTFAKYVIHDIKSLVTSLKILDQLITKKLSEDEKEILELSIEGIEGITKGLLDKYCIKNTKITCTAEKEEIIYLHEYLQHIVSHKQRQFKQRNINFNYVQNNKKAFIKGSKANFSRMLSNVINNAIEAIEENKSGEISVSYKVIEDNVEVKIKDNGKGMPKEMVHKIMNKVRIEPRKENGHGIGLEHIIKTVEEMKGNICVYSQENEGTEFVFTFQTTHKNN
ncbi:MAG: GHKL domain-containing protein [Endomicrobium sp.]|uniref:ATP-binding protein n=1 Tax=Candidatus Endomicrobiellum cubanum TaxID=3242325 RepID=UPI00281E2725|nr:GHKL domain-containing protein [Endomicrobium sp.]